MKRFILCCALSATFTAITQTKELPKDVNPNYDASLAADLGADDYGMKNYFLVILKTGKNTTDDKEFVSKSFKGHMSNMEQMVKEGKLILAGPLQQNDQAYRGIFVFDNVTNESEAHRLLQTDPAIRSNLLDYDLYQWYGSAALVKYLSYSEKIWKVKP
ncbi:MAG TPA: hypothetical protein DDY13_19310 [Cytophagales bacterium]|jgi:uncharacterized protein YciI|nr:hypothetical protein [Cytophagales bacterium]